MNGMRDNTAPPETAAETTLEVPVEVADATLRMQLPTPAVQLGPYEQYASALAAGNLGMTNGQWADYDTQGRPGEWFIVPAKN
jgi:hypothetical protein